MIDYFNCESIAENLKASVVKNSKLISIKSGVFLNLSLAKDFLVVVLTGRIKTYSVCGSGKTTFIGRIDPGHACPVSINNLLGQPTPEIRCISDRDSTLLLVPKTIFKRLFMESPYFREYITKKIAFFSASLVNLLREVSFYKLSKRVANLLIILSKKENNTRINITHQAIANELGSTRVVISRILKDLEKEKLIQLNRGEIHILNKNQLDKTPTHESTEA